MILKLNTMVRPTLVETKYGQNCYDKNEFNNFFDKTNLNYITSDISKKCIYIESKTISQNKLRESGFTITRNRFKAVVIVISDFLNKASGYSYGPKNTIGIPENSCIEDFFNNFNSSYSYIKDKDIYKYLYKYDGNKELFNSCQELFNSKNNDNVRMAMEFISNANWIDNEIYLKELFNLYWDRGSNNMKRNDYKTSISFNGFTKSLDFNYYNVNLNRASDYMNLCKNDEHHDWVYNKYEEEFKEELNELFIKHKMKIDKIEYSIDKSLIYEDVNN